MNVTSINGIRRCYDVIISYLISEITNFSHIMVDCSSLIHSSFMISSRRIGQIIALFLIFMLRLQLIFILL
jgi:hypothetical protein